MAKTYALAAVMAGLFTTAFAGQASASTVVYDLTLTATYDSQGATLATYDGTGTITLGSAPSASGTTDYATAQVTFTVDGQMFSGTATDVAFLNGSFNSAQFSEQIGSNPNRFDLQTSGVYAYYYDNEGQDASGSITSSLAATPLPAALPLFAGGLGIMGLFGRRRKRMADATAA
jgi:hypothetical protein